MFLQDKTFTAEELAALIRQTDLLTPEEKEKLISYMGQFSDEERKILGNQIVGYEQKKVEIIKDAEARKRKIEEDYYKKLQDLYATQQKLMHAELKRREEADTKDAAAEADRLMEMM